VSKSNFYYHFKSKEDLGIAVLEQRRENFEGLMTATLKNPDATPQERLQHFFTLLAEMQEGRLGQGGCPFGNLVVEVAEQSERFRCQLIAIFEGMTSVIADLIAEGQRLGEFRRDVSHADLAALIVQTIQGMLLMAKCHKQVGSMERSSTLLLKLIEAA
ncbi:MAG TPA: TetR family transcriptional regulator C-terminal domain-containing protein, partial [Chthonomonadales bacterium]|nr:TetR family transcriptional regulator C-terminal domain-containing protein [Chthonomonadales bacterium]